jgi:hypothetical protein
MNCGFDRALRSRCTPMLAGLRTLIQTQLGPDRLVSSILFALGTEPARTGEHGRPILDTVFVKQDCLPWCFAARASAALRSRNARLRRSSPSCSIKSKARFEPPHGGATPRIVTNHRVGAALLSIAKLLALINSAAAIDTSRTVQSYALRL